VTGSRDWGDRLAVYRALNDICDEFDLNYPPDEYGNTMPDAAKVTIVHGACPTGADAIADDWAIGNFLVPERHPADWAKHGRAAGPIRNREMVGLGADISTAFIGDCSSPRCNVGGKHPSHGATGCADLAEAAGIPVRRFFA